MREHKIEETILQKYHKAIPNSKFEQLTPEIWIWRGFLTKEECKSIVDEALSHEEWEYMDKTEVPRLADFSEKIASGFDGDIRVGDFRFVRIFKTSWGMIPHTDIYGWQNRFLKGIVGPDHDKPTTEIHQSSYSTLLYYNDDFEGGEIVYPEYDMEYKPVAGDLLIHTTEVVHGVKKVKSGTRYSSQATMDQSFLMDKEFHDNFNWPMTPDDEQTIQNGKTFENGDFHFDVIAPVIANDRLRAWADTQENFLEYANPCGEPGCKCKNVVNISVD